MSCRAGTHVRTISNHRVSAARPGPHSVAQRLPESRRRGGCAGRACVGSRCGCGFGARALSRPCGRGGGGRGGGTGRRRRRGLGSGGTRGRDSRQCIKHTASKRTVDSRGGRGWVRNLGSQRDSCRDEHVSGMLQGVLRLRHLSRTTTGAPASLATQTAGSSGMSATDVRSRYA